MYCTKCGKLLENGVCPNCGQTETNQPNEQTQYNGVAQQPVQSPVQPSIQQTAQTPIQQGYPQPQYAQQPNGYYPPAEPDKSNAGLNLLSFFVPLFGIIWYFVKRDERPIEAKGTFKSALASIIIAVVIPMLVFIGLFIIGIVAGIAGV